MNPLIVGVVGPCGSGKSTLIRGLRAKGYIARHIAQEHSYVQDMWERITNPDILVYLDTSYEETVRRKNLNWSKKEFDKQLYRLKHAKDSSDIYIHTDNLSITQVLDAVIDGLTQSS